jgi:signal transduction histidine kinase
VRESPADVVQQTVDYFEHRLPRQRSRVTLDLETEAGLPLVPLNRELITWVLENLIKNAMDAADKPEGRVAIRVGRDGGSGVSIVVRDNGRGVPPGMEKQIFRPGVSTRRRGWGLGLALAHRIVSEYHRGRLELTWTQLGQGAEFTIFLPGE